MPKSPFLKTAVELVPVLSVSPHSADHDVLEDIFRQHAVSAGRQDREVRSIRSRTLENAAGRLRRDQIPIAICDEECAWRGLLEQTSKMPHFPLVILASRLADERMWDEVLNSGGWNLLAKPFDPAETISVIESAWRYWRARPIAALRYPWTIPLHCCGEAFAFSRHC